MTALQQSGAGQGRERHRGRVRARQDRGDREGSDGREAAAADTYPIGTKRICIDTDYFETFNRPNVTLVDIRSAPIREVTPDGDRGGRSRIPARRDRVRDRLRRDDRRHSPRSTSACGDLTLNGKWAEGPKSYLGLMVAGFPNLFIITGPGSPSVLSNMMVSIEQHVDWIADCLAHLREHGIDRIEATRDAEDRWVAHVNEVAHKTLYPQANSWYMGANIPGKPRIFMPYIGGVNVYRRICDAVVAKGYEGFALTRREQVRAAE